MMMFDNKKALMTMMGRRKPASMPAPMQEEKVMNAEGEVDGRYLAMQDALSAIHEKSPERLMQAMMDFHDLHSAESVGSDDK